MNLSAGEVLGLAAVIGLITGALAVCLVPLVVERLLRRIETHQHKLTAYENWLNARFTFSRSSKEFIESFRKMRQAPNGSPTPDELPHAKESRQRWLAALAEWEHHTAHLLVRCDDTHIGATLRSFEQPDAQAIRAAIGKGQAEVDRLCAQLDELDRLAVITVRGVVRESRDNGWAIFSRGADMLRHIVHRLSQP